MKLVVANHKMNLLSNEINKYIDFFKEKNYSNVFFAPSSIYLQTFIDNGLNAVAQDVSNNEIGAYTGDISCTQLKSIGVNYAIIGHSERRKYHHDDEIVNGKIARCLEQEIIPILCIGENKEEKDNNLVSDVLTKEIDDAFTKIKPEFLKEVIIAYEPIWSIGTGVIPTNEDISSITSFIKNYVSVKYGFDIKVLYGGSVNNKNILELEQIDNIDGYLIGGCSLKIEDFNNLIEKVQ